MKLTASKNIASSNRVSCGKVTKANRATAEREGKWLERPRNVFVLMSKFATCAKVENLLETLPLDFEARTRPGIGTNLNFETSLCAVSLFSEAAIGVTSSEA